MNLLTAVRDLPRHGIHARLAHEMGLGLTHRHAGRGNVHPVVARAAGPL